MVRRWLVPPDFEAQTPSGVVAAVSLDALIGGLAEAATILHRAGGHLQVSQQRIPGILDHEMVTLGAVIEWRDRTDAKTQPESVTAPSELPQEPLGAPEEEFEPVDQPTVEMRPQLADDEEVDESSIPVALRG